MRTKLSSAPRLGIRDRDIRKEPESCFAKCFDRSWRGRSREKTLVIQIGGCLSANWRAREPLGIIQIRQSHY